MNHNFIDLTEDDDIQPIFVPRNSNTFSNISNDRRTRSLPINYHSTLIESSSVGVISSSGSSKPVLSFQTFLVNNELHLEECGWREEEVRSLPLDLGIKVNSVYIPPWGVPGGLSDDDKVRLWQRAIQDQHFFVSIDDIDTFIKKKFMGRVPIEPPSDIRSLSVVDSSNQIGMKDLNPPNTGMANQSSDPSSKKSGLKVVRSHRKLEKGGSEDVVHKVSLEKRAGLTPSSNTLSANQSAGDVSFSSVSQQQEIPIHYSVANSNAINSTSGRFSTQQLSTFPHHASPSRAENNPEFSTGMLESDRTIIESSSSFHMNSMRRKELNKRESDQNEMTKLAAKRLKQPLNQIDSKQEMALTEIESSDRIISSVPSTPVRVSYGYDQTGSASSSLRSLSSSISKPKLSPQITDFFPRIGHGGISSSESKNLLKTSQHEGTKDDESPSKSLAKDMGDSSLDNDDSSSYHTNASISALITTRKRVSRANRSQPIALTSGIGLDATTADIYGLRKPTFGKMSQELEERGWVFTTWPECLKGLNLSADVRKKYRIHQDFCENAFFSPEGARLFNEGRHHELETDKHLFSMPDNVVSYVREYEPDTYAEICEKLDLIPPDRSFRFQPLSRRRSRDSNGSSASTTIAGERTMIEESISNLTSSKRNIDSLVSKPDSTTLKKRKVSNKDTAKNVHDQEQSGENQSVIPVDQKEVLSSERSILAKEIISQPSRMTAQSNGTKNDIDVAKNSVSSCLVCIGSRIFVQKCIFEKQRKTSPHSSNDLWFEGEVASIDDDVVKVSFQDGEEACILDFNIGSCNWWPADRFLREISKGCFKNNFVRLSNSQIADAVQEESTHQDSITNNDADDSMFQSANTSSETVKLIETERISVDHESIDYFRDVSIQDELMIQDNSFNDLDESDGLGEIVVTDDSSTSSSDDDSSCVVDEEDLDDEIKKWLPPSNQHQKIKLLDEATIELISEANKIINDKTENLRIGDIWDYLFLLGWKRVRSNFVDHPKADTCYVAPWTNQRLDINISNYRQRKKMLRTLVEGRDYFFDNETLLRYIKTFLVHYNHTGLSSESENIKRRRSFSQYQSDSQRSDAQSTEIIVHKQKKKPRPLQLQSIRDEKILQWKQLGHVFFDASSSNKDPFLNRGVRRFYANDSGKGNPVCKRYFDGRCISFRPASLSTQTSSDRITAEWGIIYDDVTAFDQGYELLDLVDTYQAVYDFEMKTTFLSSLRWSKRHSYYTIPENVSSSSSSSSTMRSEHPSLQTQLDGLKQAYEKKIASLDSKLRSEYQNSKRLVERIESLESKHNSQTSIIDKLKSSHQSVINQLLKEHRKKILEVQNEYDRKHNEQKETIRRENIFQSRKQRMQQELSSSSSSAHHEANKLTSSTEMKLKLWNNYLLLLLKKKKSNTSDQANSSYARDLDFIPNRIEICVLKDENYPIQTTINIFKASQMNSGALVRVTFKRSEQTEVRNRTQVRRSDELSNMDPRNSNQTRIVEVAEVARDDGGLLRQWMTDFLEGMKVHLLTLSYIPKYYTSSSRASEVKFQLFYAEAGAIHYFPSQIKIPTTDITISFDEPLDDPDAEEERQLIRDHYVTFGKVLNYLFREGMPIPSPFATTFLLLYLTSDPLEYDNKSYRLSYLGRYGDRLSSQQLIQAVRDLDPLYEGAIRSFLEDCSDDAHVSEESMAQMYEEFIYPMIIQPRLSALQAIKEGFDQFPVASHLQVFSYSELYENFIGEDVYTWDDVSKHIVYEIGIETIFQHHVSEALSQLNHEELRNLILLATGSTLFQRGGSHPTSISIKPKNSDFTNYPRWPLPTSRTCFSEIFVPFLKSKPISDLIDSLPNQASSLWTVENVLANIRGALHHSIGEFHDRPQSA